MNSRRRSLRCGFALGFALLLLASFAGASQLVRVERRIEIDLLVPPIQSLDVSHAVVAPPILQAQDFNRGYFQFADPIWVTIASNVPWELAIRRPPGGVAISAHLEELQIQNDTRVLNVTDPWQTLIRGTETKKATLPFQVRIPLSWTTTIPGNYEPRVEYRLGSDQVYP